MSFDPPSDMSGTVLGAEEFEHAARMRERLVGEIREAGGWIGFDRYMEAALYAPGRDILTLMPGGHYDFATGDSIATAQVTGVVALLLATHHALTASAAYKLLQDSSVAPGTAPGDPANAAGAVDACAAVTALMGRGTCTQPTGTAGGPPGDRNDHLALH